MEESRRRRKNAAFALDAFDDDRADVRAHVLLHRVEIAVRNVRDSLDPTEALAVLRRAGQRHRAHRAAVERVVERDELRALRVALRMEVTTRELEQRLVRLRARVAEERAIEAALRAELVGEEDVLFVPEVVRHVRHACGLIGDRRDELRMRMADRAHRDSGTEIEPALPVDIEEIASATAMHDDRRRLVVRIEPLAGDREELGARRTSRGRHLGRGLYPEGVHGKKMRPFWSSKKIQIVESRGTS